MRGKIVAGDKVEVSYDEGFLGSATGIFVRHDPEHGYLVEVDGEQHYYRYARLMK